MIFYKKTGVVVKKLDSQFFERFMENTFFFLITRTA